MYSLCYGGIWMAVYDILRVFRKLVRHSYTAVGAEDFVYWICTGIGIFRFLYRENDGTIRGFVLVGIGLGMLLFSKGISRFSVPAVSWVLYRIVVVPLKCIKRFLKNLLQPFARMCKTFGRAVRKRARKRLKKEEDCSTIETESAFERKEKHVGKTEKTKKSVS